MIYSGIKLYEVFKVKDYKDMNIFEKERFQELCTFSKKELFSDFLFHLNDAYDYNKKIYDQDIKTFKTCLKYYFIANGYLFIGLIILLIYKTI